MGLLVTKVELGNEFNDIKTNWLKNLIMEKIPFSIWFEVETIIQAWADNELEYAPLSYAHKNIIQFATGGIEKLYAGDTIRLVDPSTANDGTYIIKQIIDYRTMSVYDSDGVTEPTFSNATSDDATITVIDVVDKCKFNWNFIENEEDVNFFSKVTGSKQEASAGSLDAADTTPVSMILEGNKYWQIGDVSIQGVSLTDSGINYISKFKLTGNFYLTPAFLASQWADLIDDIAPDYFFNLKALKLAYRIEASYQNRSEQYCQFYEESSVLGDSGWFSERFNNRPTNYEIDSVVIENGATVLDAIQLTEDEMDLTVVITNSVDDPFISGLTFVLNICIAPETEEEYKGNDVKNNYLAYNFRFDRAKNTVGAASVDGEQWGVAGRQILKDVEATLDSAEQITLTAKILMDGDLVDYLKTLDNPRYLIWVTTGLETPVGASGVITYTIPVQTPSSTGAILYIGGVALFNGVDCSGSTTGAWATNLAAAVNASAIADGWSYSGVAWEAAGARVLSITITSPIGTIYNGLVGTGIDFETRTFSPNTGALSGGYETSYDNDDRVALKIGSDDFYINLAPDGLVEEVTTDDTFIEHPYDEASEAIQNVKSFPEDRITAYKRIKIDLGQSDYDLSMKSIRCGIRVKNSVTGDTFDIDEEVADFSSSTIVNGLEFIDLTQPRVFKAPVTDPIKNFIVQRDISADSGNNRFYDIYFPFINRFEYWIENLGVNSAFFDDTEDNNGLNQEWYRFSNLANWQVYFFVETVISNKGEDQTYTIEEPYDIQDYLSGTNWDEEDINTYDIDDNPLTSGGDDFILGYADTKVVAEFTWQGVTSRPSASQIGMAFYLNTFENGGIVSQTMITSYRDVGSESQWKSEDTSNRIIVTEEAGDEIHGTALIDFTKLSPFYKYTITARIYDLRDIQS